MVDHHRRDGREVRDDQLVRARRVARVDRVGDLLVRGDHAGPEVGFRAGADVLGVGGPCLLVVRPQALEGADDDHQRGVAAAVDDRLMELLEDECRPCHVLGLDRATADVELAELRDEDRVPIRPLRGVRRARGLDHREGRGEIVERDVACLQDQAEGAGGVLGRRSMHLRAADVPSTDGDEALALEDSQRFPERRS